MAGTTYFCTDRHGNIYSRYSVQHREPQYLFAAIDRRAGSTQPVAKGQVAYSRARSGAQAAADRHLRNGYYDYVTRTILPLEAEVVEVRAYPGKHKVEPTTTETPAEGGWPDDVEDHYSVAAAPEPEAL
jgi:hypothetical protein